MKIYKSVLLAASLTLLAFGFASAQGQTDDQLRRVMSFPIDDIMKAKKMIDTYTPEGRIVLVDEPGSDWTKRAVSMKKREEWITSSKYWAGYGPETPDKKRVLYAAFDELKASAESKLPNYLPKDSFFKFRNAEEEEYMKAAISNLSDAKIFKIGMAQDQWTVDNGSNGIPINRFKRGYIYMKFNEETTGHKYCTLLMMSVIEKYSGGGTFAAPYGKRITNELCGCPK